MDFLVELATSIGWKGLLEIGVRAIAWAQQLAQKEGISSDEFEARHNLAMARLDRDTDAVIARLKALVGQP